MRRPRRSTLFPYTPLVESAKPPAPPTASHLSAVVGQASACQRPLAGALRIEQSTIDNGAIIATGDLPYGRGTDEHFDFAPDGEIHPRQGEGRRLYEHQRSGAYRGAAHAGGRTP